LQGTLRGYDDDEDEDKDEDEDEEVRSIDAYIYMR